MEYFDPETGEKYVPYVIEPSLGADRVTLAFLCDAYDEEVLEGGDTRTVMRFHPALAPYKAAILPLSKKLREPAQKIFAGLAKKYMVDYDDAGAIGRRYRRPHVHHLRLRFRDRRLRHRPGPGHHGPGADAHW